MAPEPERQPGSFDLWTTDGADELALLDRHGVVPLPPYINRPAGGSRALPDGVRRAAGSVAAPTAGLHLTPAVLDGCRAVGVRIEMVDLVVGMGTFRPISALKVEDHHMHAERYQVGAGTMAACEEARAAGGRVVAVGTTTVRALESAALSGQLEGRTELFIRRPWRWRGGRAADQLPPAPLVVAGADRRLRRGPVGDLYGTALSAGYRFLSFGDAMLLDRSL